MSDASAAASVAAAPAANRSPRRWPIHFVLLAAIWGSSFLFTQIAVAEFGVFPTAAVRVAVATLFLLPLLWLRRLGPLLRQHWKPVFLIGVLNSAVPFTCFSFALLSITTGLSAILNATVPLFGALVAWIWLKDRPAGAQVLGLAIGFAGVALLAGGEASFKPDASGFAPAWAVLACLLGTVCYAVSASAARRYLGGLPPLVIATGSQAGAMLALTLPALWFWPAQLPGAKAWLAIVFVGIVCTGLAYVLYFRLIDQAGPTRALAVTFVVPVFALMYGGLFLGETITGWMLWCAGIIVCGTALSTGLLKLRRVAFRQ